MDRLTRIDVGGLVTGVRKPNGDFAGTQEMLIRLKEYEDLDMTPQQIEEELQYYKDVLNDIEEMEDSNENENNRANP